jgi:hypothetical protein
MKTACRTSIPALATAYFVPNKSCIQRYDAGRVVILFSVPASASVGIVPPKDIAGIHAACGIRKRIGLSRLAVVCDSLLLLSVRAA